MLLCKGPLNKADLLANSKKPILLLKEKHLAGV